MNLRFIDWIWHVRGSLALEPGQSSDDAFDRLAPLFREAGTNHHRTNETLTFTKKHQAAQDKMSVFDGGVLRIDKASVAPVLRYNLISRALLFCFLAPFLFLVLAQVTITLSKFEKPPHEAAKKHVAPIPLNPIDKALGAPAPDNSKKTDADTGKKGKSLSPTPAYVFAVFFAILYVVGRILEDRLASSLFRKTLRGSETTAAFVTT